MHQLLSRTIRLSHTARRVGITGAIAALGLSVLLFLSAHDYGSLIEASVAPASVPPQVAGAVVGAPTTPLPSLSQTPSATSTLPVVDHSSPPPRIEAPESTPSPTPIVPQSPSTTSPASFVYTFTTDGVLHEARSMELSSSPYFWLSAGGSFVIQDGLGATMQGLSPLLSRWRLSYVRWNPLDTESGYRPQNVFRLVTRQRFADARVEAYMRIERDNLAESPNRNQSNGLLLMTRYQDKDTLYYAGLRVDGTAVIKKKYKGVYYTMAQKPIVPGTYSYTTNPNLLPHGQWLAVHSDTRVDAQGGVTVRLYLKRPAEEDFTLLLSAYDDGKTYGGTPPISGDGHVGIRTDFMDVSFKSFRIDPL